MGSGIARSDVTQQNALDVLPHLKRKELYLQFLIKKSIRVYTCKFSLINRSTIQLNCIYSTKNLLFLRVSGKEMVKILSKFGFEVLDQKGSHVIMIGFRNGMKRKPVVPMHAELRKGTLLSILKQADVSRKELEKILK